ncbi:MAG: hypothetical protein MK212_21305 [Saprospiraceae bacterium]|nr:hypothetical protein [Saprospiraceae bacterium]
MLILILIICAISTMQAQLHTIPNPEFAPPPNVKIMTQKFYILGNNGNYKFSGTDKIYFDCDGKRTKFEYYTIDKKLSKEKNYKFDATGREIGWIYVDHNTSHTTEETYNFEALQNNRDQYYYTKEGLLEKSITFRNVEDTTWTNYHYNKQKQLTYIQQEEKYVFYGCSQTEVEEYRYRSSITEYIYNKLGQLEIIKSNNSNGFRKLDYDKKGQKIKASTYSTLKSEPISYTTYQYSFWK